MHRHLRWGSRLGLAFVALTVLAGATAAGPVPAATEGPAAAIGGATSPPLIYHSSLFTNVSSPQGTTSPGEVIGASYRVIAATYPASAGPATVRIPSAIAEIPTSTGLVHLYFSSANLTVNSSAATTVSAGPSDRFNAPLSFNASSPSLLTSSGVAVMASWPAGTYSIQFRWQWVLEAPDGSTTFGPWSVATTVTPAQLADLSFPDGPTWTLGSAKTLCIAGPVGGRTFSAHLSTGNPSSVYVTGTASVPAGQSGPYCWSNTLPSAPTAQSAFLHLWEYGNLTYELDVVLVPLVAPTSPVAGGTAPGGQLVGIAAIVGVGATVVVFEAVYLLYPKAVGRVLPKRLRRPGGPPTPPAGADPTPLPPETLPPPPPPPGVGPHD